MKELVCILSIVFAIDFQGNDDYEVARKRMVSTQIKMRGIHDTATLAAMLSVPRHKFVPADLTHLAYRDRPVRIGYGQTISQPYMVAFMTEILQLEKDFKVLEIGTGSGYQAAILAEIVDSVYTLEIITALGTAAKKRLEDMDYDNISVKNTDGYFGWKEKGPFDAIIVTAAAEHVPPPLLAQLKDGGRMIIPVGSPFMIQQLLLVEKEDNRTKTKNLMFVRFVPLTRSD
ncbi:MAG: protein-L-isoaspartate(D-aspartate) O-methyltransferase [Flavobacteriales bacterium]|nr:protein-L-isoaspartate(D-aspartate) O-methyltransferase [Flavobacteriales bacterium]